ncbi:hypothetical protein [Acidithiobacillus ferriphilus]|uniref:hypothetical protein n=1 Tax=Acidithiobacillus ferriphilus TaxID=1689834 RepID=UPI0023315B57|nr:hypothetical protein [Acidithiobacillus ferriphilus]WCE94218.1 hypothetical protein PJU76_01345 [Acidithiobacillus ferriphilus]
MNTLKNGYRYKIISLAMFAALPMMIETGLVQFYPQAGAYNVMALDSSYFSNSYQSWNIERGLLWNQGNAANLIGFGPRSHAWSLTVTPTYQNDGFSPC